MKAKSKAREPTIPKVYNVFTFLGSFGVFYSWITVFLSFKVIKAKKAATLAGKAELQMRKFIEPKVHL